MAYSLFDHTGDLGVKVSARSLDLLFADAALALTDTLTDLRLVFVARSVAVTIGSTAVDLLLIDWLNELIYRFDTDKLVVARVDVSVTDEGGKWSVRGTVSGENFDPARHPAKTLVKAATYHALEVLRDGEEWRATIVLDL